MTRFSRGAAWRLLAATAAWGLSFPTAKALMLLQGELLTGKPAWFHAAFVLWNRMFLAAAVLAVLYRRRIAALRPLEWRQGVELGLFGGVGMLLQTDAQNYVAASTSAFFTQFTCVFVPLLVAWRLRAWPSLRVLLAVSMVMAGCALLNGAGSGDWIFGRGEWETILSAVLFTGQILSLDRNRYSTNEMSAVAAVMFATKAVVFLPVVLWGGGGLARLGTLYASGGVWGITAILTAFCTVFAYTTMTRWQPRVSSVHAGLIYATEPVFATVWALFLPGMYSRWCGLDYANERLGAGFFWGAALVLAANVLILAGRRTPDPA